jgi:drug/metabolite transporter (DMT)-like permease
MAHKAIDFQAAGIMVVLCAIWGFQQIAMKGAAADVAPVLQIAIRSGLSALMVAALMRLRGERLSPGLWRPGALVGFLFGLEFILVGEGLRRTSAAHMAVFLYTAPIFAAIGLHLKVASERLRPLQWAGVGLAFCGIAAAFLGHPGAAARASSSIGDVMGILAGAAWGLTTVAVRGSKLTAAPAAETLLYQLLGAFVMLSFTAAVSGQTGFRPSATAWASLAFQTLLVSFASYLTWFWLLRRYIASRLGVFSFLTPLFGVAFGVWLLREPLEPSFGVGAALVLAGIVLVSATAWLSKRPAARASG